MMNWRDIQIFCDCICQFTKDGEIIPIKVQFIDEDGNNEVHKILGYKVKDNVGSNMIGFECKINYHDEIKILDLVYNRYSSIWFLRPKRV